jgi:DNA-binding response OmpR family regulator
MSARLLLVDDERSILFALGDFFSDWGFQVRTASSLGEARRELETQPFDAALVDLQLSPEERCGGRRLVAELRQRWPHTRVVVLTAYGSPAVVKQMEALRVDALLSKPHPLGEIARFLERMLRREGQP